MTMLLGCSYKASANSFDTGRLPPERQCAWAAPTIVHEMYSLQSPLPFQSVMYHLVADRQQCQNCTSSCSWR